jgi:lipopolysaccharide biosynthesis protein
MTKKLRPIAFHLPQFHPIPENDEWWGRGFTEWTNVTKARPLFDGHYQPHLPTDLGFYDLRLPEARRAQADLAREYGIHGFCYYHYWFNGRRLLEKPVEAILQSGEPDFPFMLCWANENWSRRWDGGEDKLLMKQDYHDGDAEEHIRALLPYFQDPRYIRIDGRPVFAVYRPGLITNLESYLAIFRREAAKAGLDLYLCRVEAADRFRTQPGAAFFDSAIEFQPQSEMLYAFIDHVLQEKTLTGKLRRLSHKAARRLGQAEWAERDDHKRRYYLDYQEYVDYLLTHYRYPEYKRFPGLTPMWDNTARRGERAFLLKNSAPGKYEQWLSHHVENFQPPSTEENLIFINAWNEWAEGNHLEPCRRWGRAYLEATRRSLAFNPAVSPLDQNVMLSR